MPKPTQKIIQRVLIVDDEYPARMRLKLMVEALDDYKVIAEAVNGEQAVEAVEADCPDVVLMDIRMPGTDGLQAAHQLAALEYPPAVIFCTAFDEHALAAFDAQAMGYLLKPIKSECLLKELEKAAQVNRAQLSALRQTENTAVRANGNQKPALKYLLAKTSRGEERINVDDIRALVADKKYVSAYLGGREIILDQSLKALEAQLEGLFIRVHRNALVAERYIVSIESVSKSEQQASETPLGQYRVKLKGSDVAPLVSRRHIAQLRRLIRLS